MLSSPSTSGPFRCPVCGATSVSPTKCDKCNLPMLDVSDATTKTSVRRLAGATPATIGGFIAAAWLATNFALNAFLIQTAGPIVHSAGGLRLVGNRGAAWMVANAVLTGLVVGIGWFFARRARRGSAKRERRWPASPAVQAIANMSPGLVALQGRVRSAGRVLELDGRECVAATTERTEGPLAPALVTHMTDFELESATGERTLVRASDALVTGALDTDALGVVSVGSEVIVRGHATRVPSRSGERADYRAGAWELELASGPLEPLRIRVLAEPEETIAAPLAVRVADDASEHSTETETIEAEHSEPTRGKAT